MEVHCQPTRKRTEASLEVLALLLSVEARFLTNGIINQTMIPRFVLTRLNQQYTPYGPQPENLPPPDWVFLSPSPLGLIGLDPVTK